MEDGEWMGSRCVCFKGSVIFRHNSFLTKPIHSLSFSI